MNKKDLEHTVKNLHLSPEAKDRIARYLDSIPKGEEVFHAEPIQHTSFLHHIGIGMAACAMLAVGIGSIWAFKTAAPIPDPMEPTTIGIPDAASAVPPDETVLSVPDFSDKPTYYTFIEGTGIFKNEYQPDAFAFSLTSDEQRTLSSVISSCAWRELSDTPLFEGVNCLVLDFDNSVLEIWMNPSTEDNTFDVRYMADKETGEQIWYEADTQVYQDIMGVVDPYITAQLNSGIVDCIPNIQYDTDLRLSFVSNPDAKDRFYLIDGKPLDMLVYAFSNVKWGYDLYRENTDVNAWQTDTFLPAQSPTYCLYVHTPNNELYRCTVWLDTNGSDQIEFLRYTEDRLVGSRYSIEFDSDMKEALAACAEEHIYGGYVPDKPDEFYTVTMWDDLLLPIEELDFSLYKKLLAEFNEEHGTYLEMPFSGEVDEAELRSLSVMSSEDFLEFLNSYTIGEGNVAEVFNTDQEQVMLKPLGNAIRMAEKVKVMYTELAPNANTIIHHYALSNSNISDADIIEALAYMITDLTASTTDENPNPKEECLHIDTGSHNIRFYSLDAISVSPTLYVTFKGVDTELQSYYIDKDEYDKLTACLDKVEDPYDINRLAEEFESQPTPPFADLIREVSAVEGSYSLDQTAESVSYLLEASQIEEIAEIFENAVFSRKFDRHDHIGTNYGNIQLYSPKDEFSFAVFLYQENGSLVDLCIFYTGTDYDGTRISGLYLTVDDISIAKKLISIIEERA